MPNISVRDLAIQKKENDLVAGTFEEEYTSWLLSLRTYDLDNKDKEAMLFSPRESYWYLQKRVLGGRKSITRW